MLHSPNIVYSKLGLQTIQDDSFVPNYFTLLTDDDDDDGKGDSDEIDVTSC